MSDDLKRVTAEVGRLYQDAREEERVAETDGRRIFCAGMVSAYSHILAVITAEAVPS